MKRFFALFLIICILSSLCACSKNGTSAQIVATTKPVYAFTEYLCRGTNISVACLMEQNVSCLHEYTLQVNQIRMLEDAQIIIVSGAGLDSAFLEYIQPVQEVIDCSESVVLLCTDETHAHSHDHNHEHDPHIWLSPKNAIIMADNISTQLTQIYPQYKDLFHANLTSLVKKLNDLQQYGNDALSTLECRDIITFHDGFSYLADDFNLNIIASIEEESGSEASAAKIIELTSLVESHNLPAIFTERAGSAASASIISSETGVAVYNLDLAMANADYFAAMYHNINTLREALG